MLLNPLMSQHGGHDGPAQTPGRDSLGQDMDREDVSSSLRVASLGSWETEGWPGLGKHGSLCKPNGQSEPLLLIMGTHHCLHS